MMRRFLSLVLVAPLLLGAHRPAAPATVGGPGCGFWWDCGGHRIIESADGIYDWPHFECMTCTTGSCHGRSGCGYVVEDAEAYAQAIRAAEVGDRAEIRRLASSLPDYIVVNRERRSFQILSCDRSTVVANIPIVAASSD